MKKAYKREVCKSCKKISTNTLVDIVRGKTVIVCLDCVGK